MVARAEQHQMHGGQPVRPVPDVTGAAHGLVCGLGFQVDVLVGAPVARLGRTKGDNGRWGAPGRHRPMLGTAAHADEPA